MNRAQRNLRALMSDTLGAAVSFRPVPSGKAWGSAAHVNAQRAFAKWLERAYPAIYELAMVEAGNGEPGAGLGNAEGEQSLLDRFTATVQDLAPTYLQYKAQKDILDVQLERARQGLPPLETGEYAPTMQIGLDQATVQRIANEAAARASAGAGAVFSNPMTWLALGVGAFALFGGFGGGGRAGGGSRAPRRRR